MTGKVPETLEIKDQSEVKDILKKQSVETLDTNNSNKFKKIQKTLVENGINILNSDSSEIIRYKDGSFLVAEKNADNTLTPWVKIANKGIMEQFLTHIINYELGEHYRDAMVNITEFKEKRQIEISYRKEIADLKGEIVPHVKDIGEYLRALEAHYDTIRKGLRTDIGKRYKDRQFRINEEIITKITKEHYKHILFINNFRKNKLGYDGLKDVSKYDEDMKDWKRYDSMLIKHKVEIMEIYRQFNKILAYTGDYEALKGTTDLGDIDIEILGINELEDFAKLLKTTLDIDKKKTEEMMTVAMLKLEDEDFKDLYQHLKDVAEHDLDPTQEKFKPQNMAKVEALVVQYPILGKYIALDKKKETKELEKEEEKKKKERIPTPGTGAETPEEADDLDSASNLGFWDTFKKKGLRGSVRKIFDAFPQMANSTKNTWTNLLVMGGVGFGLFKLGRRLFTGKFSKGQEKKTPFRQRILIAGGVTLGFNAFGSNPAKFAREFIGGGLDPSKAKFDIAKLWKGNPEAEEATEEGSLDVDGTLQIFGPSPVSKLKEWIDPKTMELTQAGYNGLLINFQDDSDKKDIVIKMWKNKNKGILKNSLAAMGITSANLNTIEKTVAEAAQEYAPVLDDGTLDYRDGVDKQKIADQVEDFDLTEKQKNRLIKYGNLLYNEQTGSSARENVEFKLRGDELLLKTYNERTPFDPEYLTLPGLDKLTGPIVFESPMELFKAANLTNYMKHLYRGKATGEIARPFEEAKTHEVRNRGDIKFRSGEKKDLKITDLAVATDVIKGGRFGSLKDISPTLNNHRSGYIKYLNNFEIWNEADKEKDLPEGVSSSPTDDKSSPDDPKKKIKTS